MASTSECPLEEASKVADDGTLRVEARTRLSEVASTEEFQKDLDGQAKVLQNELQNVAYSIGHRDHELKAKDSELQEVRVNLNGIQDEMDEVNSQLKVQCQRKCEESSDKASEDSKAFREELMTEESEAVRLARTCQNHPKGVCDGADPQESTPQRSKRQIFTQICVACGSEAMLRCGGCGLALYCSVTCQQKDWVGHAGECGWASPPRAGTQPNTQRGQKLQHDGVCRRGVVNDHNNCWFSAVLQSLESCGLEGFADLAGHPNPKPVQLPKVLHLQDGHHQDAAEALNLLLETSDVCSGLCLSHVACNRWGCDGQSVDTSGFTVLPLSLTKASSVASAVQHFAAGEQVEWKCNRCSTDMLARKKLSFLAAPTCLILHLMRFTAGFPYGKVSTHVDFSPCLEIPVGDEVTIQYSLRAVIVHKDQGSPDFGHYVAYCFCSCGNWLLCDDETITTVDIETVLQQQAYILCYVQQD